MEKAKRRLMVLGAFSALSAVGIAYLTVKARGLAPQWFATAAASPLAVRCLVIMGVGVLALALAAAVMVRREPRDRRARVRDLPGDQGASAALQMVLLLPVACIMFLVIIQAALLFNANMVVHYAAFGAARVATTAVPLDLGGEGRNLVYNPDYTGGGGYSGAFSEKLERIRRAAVLAVVPISADLDLEAADAGGLAGEAVEAASALAYARLLPTRADEDPTWLRQLEEIYRTGAGGFEKPWWINRIRRQYAYANASVAFAGQDGGRTELITDVQLAKPAHWRDGDPNPDCPYRHHRRGEWTQWGWSYVPYCPYWEDRMDYWYWEDLAVQVDYKFVLSVPLARVALADADGRMDVGGERAYFARIRALGVLTNEGGPELRPED